MANRKNWLGVLVIVLVFGMMVVGCGDGSGGGTDPALNGTWGYSYIDKDDRNVTVELTFNNGNFEAKTNGTPNQKGTYTASGNKITITVTHFYMPEHIAVYYDGLESSKWYTKTELKAFSDHSFDGIFASRTGTYSVSGNTLTLTTYEYYDNEANTQTLTKK